MSYQFGKSIAPEKIIMLLFAVVGILLKALNFGFIGKHLVVLFLLLAVLKFE